MMDFIVSVAVSSCRVVISLTVALVAVGCAPNTVAVAVVTSPVHKLILNFTFVAEKQIDHASNFDLMTKRAHYIPSFAPGTARDVAVPSLTENRSLETDHVLPPLR